MTPFQPRDRVHLKGHPHTTHTTGTVRSIDDQGVHVLWDDGPVITPQVPTHLEPAGEPMSRDITIPAPHVPYPGGRTQAHFMRTAAGKIGSTRVAGGSNVTAAVVKLLHDAADALEATDREALEGEAYALYRASCLATDTTPAPDWATAKVLTDYVERDFIAIARVARELHGVTP